MYKTKLTQKGQVTIPSSYREKLHLNRGTVLNVKMLKDKIMIEKPKKSINKLFGAWKDLSDKDIEKIRNIWAGWNEKNIGKL